MPSGDMSRRALLQNAAVLGGVASRPGRLVARVPGVAKTLAAARAETWSYGTGILTKWW